MADDPNLDTRTDEQKAADAAKGKPDWEKAANTYKAERDTWKGRAEAAEGDLKGLQDSLKGALTQEDVDAAVQKALDDSKADTDARESEWKSREKALLIENALTKAGCIDTVGAMAHIDTSKVEVAQDGHVSGLDITKVKKDYVHLFAEGGAVITSAAAQGGAPPKMTREQIEAITDSSARRQAIAENMELFET